jgi:hypothetical protein
MMRVHTALATPHAVAQVSGWGLVLVILCGCAGLVVGLDRAVRGEHVAEGLGIVAAVVMATTVSSCVLLYIASAVGRPPGDDGRA